MTDEKRLERRLRQEVKKMKGLALKFVSPGFSGVPDRLVLRAGRAWFVEVKSSGKKPSPVQLFVHKLFFKIGFKVWIVDSDESLENFLNEVRSVSISGI